MKKTVRSLFLLICLGLFVVSCSDDRKITITNKTGISLYNCTVTFVNKTTGELISTEGVGDLPDNESVEVTDNGNYFNISAKDSKGKGIRSYDIHSSKDVEIYIKDLIVY